MESNKEEAVRVQEMALEVLKKGEKSRAVWLLKKSYRLFPLPEVERLISQLEGESNSTESVNPEINEADDIPRNRENSTSESSESGANGRLKSMATSEQIELVRRIRQKSDYYEILELRKDCTGEDIKKAYRKLSLKVHPDKNRAPGSEEAFKAVSEAFECLSDPSKRSTYDMTGKAPRQVISNGTNGMYRSPFDDIFDSDDVFQTFFGVHNGHGFHAHFGQPRRRRYPQGFQQQNSNSMRFNLLALLQFLPILYFLLVFLSSSPEHVYSLSAEAPFVIEKSTSNGVKFYVESEKFEEVYPFNSHKRVQLEREVESDYRRHLENMCYNERIHQRKLVHWGQFEKARNLNMPFCAELQKTVRVW